MFSKSLSELIAISFPSTICRSLLTSPLDSSDADIAKCVKSFIAREFDAEFETKFLPDNQTADKNDLKGAWGRDQFENHL